MNSDSAASVQSCPACGGSIAGSEVEPLTKLACPGCGQEVIVDEIMGAFQLLSVAGRGGMGVVYRALDLSLDREIALKVLRTSHSNDQHFIAQLKAEAGMTAAINHPHVVKVYSTGLERGRFYLAMELVEHGSLYDLIASEGRLAELRVLEIGSQIAQGLRAAHEFGLIHRDVKPGNILFASPEVAKIVDFGLAVFAADEAELRGEIWGTPYYVAPEKLDDKPEDFRSDIYSLGATLFHAMAGRPPFEAESPSLIALKHLKAQPVSLQSFAPEISGSTAYVINRTLLKDPNKRYQSYNELIEHLDYARTELLAGGPTQPAAKRVVLENSVDKKVVGLATAGMLAVIGAAVVFGLYSKRPGKSPAQVVADAPAAPALLSYQRSLQTARAKLTGTNPVGAADDFRSALSAKELPPTEINWVLLQEGFAELAAERASAAQAAFRKILERAETEPADEAGSNRFYAETARRLLAAEPVAPSAVAGKNKTGPELLALLAFALKDWQLGQVEQAGVLFRDFRSASTPASDAWLEGLKPMASNYLGQLAEFEMAAERLKAASAPNEKVNVARELLRKSKGPLAVRAKQLSAPFAAELNKPQNSAPAKATVDLAAAQWVQLGPWTSMDVGRPHLPGSATLSAAGEFVIKSNGEDITSLDQFHSVHQKVKGDFELIARVTSFANSPQGFVYERFDDLPGGDISQLTSAASFPDKPKVRTVGSGDVDFPQSAPALDKFGVRLRALFLPPLTGDYTFCVAADDGCELWLSRDQTPGGRVRIARVEGVTAFREWKHSPSQRSAPIPLEAGKAYFLEALYKEAMARDHFSVGVILPDGSQELPMSSKHLRIPQLSPISAPLGAGTAELPLVPPVPPAKGTRMHEWAKVGLVVRESFHSATPNLSFVMSGNNGFRRLRSTGTLPFFSAKPEVAQKVPGWLKMVRRGENLAYFHSTDGRTWLDCGVDRMPNLAAELYVGMGVASHDVMSITTATLDQVKLTLLEPQR